jgi:general secretion pathway protein I
MMRSHEHGFTLVEVLVALAILTLSLTAFYRLLGDGTQAGSTVRVREEALAQAEAALQRFGVDLPVVASNGVFDNGMTWQLETTPLAEREGAAGTVAQVWIVLSVRDSRGAVVARLQTGKAVARPR